MTDRTRLTLVERAVASTMETLSRRFAGFSPPFLREVVRVYGIRGAYRRLALMSEVVVELERELGMCDAHVLIGYASLWNGCYYCALGHLYISNLVYFRDTGELYPLAEGEVAEWADARDEEILQRTRECLAGAPFEPLRNLLERQVDLKWGHANVESRTDELLELSIVAYDWFNQCTIVAPDDEIVPLNELARDRALIRRYRYARERRL